MKEFNEVGSIEEYDCFKGVELEPKVKDLIEIFIEAWQECKSTPHCAECKYWHKREKGSLLACLSERYAEKVIEGGYVPVVHGRNFTKKHPVDEFICSECGIVLVDYERLEIDEDDDDENCYEYEFRFCPNCGAKIDEEEGKQ